jgi:hypothetical protein
MGHAAISLLFPVLHRLVLIFTFVSGVVYVMDGVRQLQAEGHAKRENRLGAPTTAMSGKNKRRMSRSWAGRTSANRHYLIA